ncbi:MAG: hypothetical protein R2874_10365 [Desulfobacterales bacterium]
MIRKSLTSEKSLIRKYRINLKDAGGCDQRLKGDSYQKKPGSAFEGVVR